MKVEHRYLQIEDLESVVKDLVEYMNEGGYKLLTSDDIKEVIDREENYIIIDTMNLELYEKRHLKGALHIEGTFAENEEMSKERQQELIDILGEDKEGKVIFYSSRINCRRSHVMAKWAIKLGYKDVYKSIGGTLSWKDRGYEFHSNNS